MSLHVSSRFVLLKNAFNRNISKYNLTKIRCSSNVNHENTTPPQQSALKDGPKLDDFVKEFINKSIKSSKVKAPTKIPYVNSAHRLGQNRSVYFDVYGCQMNVNDTEVIWSILQKEGFTKAECLEVADVILVITCAIREGAEGKVWNKLQYLKSLKNIRAKQKNKVGLRIGVLGCMAERLKHQLLEKEQAVDLVAGPDSYKDLPRLLALTDNNQTAVNVLLSLDETYADIMPVRLNEDSKTAFV